MNCTLDNNLQKSIKKISLNHEKISQVQQCNSPLALSIEEDNEYRGFGQTVCSKSKFAPTVELIVKFLVNNNTLNDKCSSKKCKPKTISTDLSLVIDEDENEQNDYNTPHEMKNKQKDILKIKGKKTSLENFLFDEEDELNDDNEDDNEDDTDLAKEFKNKTLKNAEEG